MYALSLFVSLNTRLIADIIIRIKYIKQKTAIPIIILIKMLIFYASLSSSIKFSGKS